MSAMSDPSKPQVECVQISEHGAGIPALLRKAAELIERDSRSLLALDLQHEHDNEYGAVLRLFFLVRWR